MFSKLVTAILFFQILLVTQTFSQVDLETIIEKANQQRLIYEETFKNVLAEEKKSQKTFDKNGNLSKLVEVESNFLVYQSNKNEDVITEYRNVTKFGGQKIAFNQKNAENFFNNLLNSNSVEEELEKIKRRNLLYESELIVSDLTLRQTPVIAEHFRPYFSFNLVEEKEGKYVIEYRQNQESPYVLINSSKSDDSKLTMDFGIIVPANIKELNARVRGKLWIDTRNFQIWREERELTIQSENSTNPLSVFQINFEFNKKNLEILVPQKITINSYKLQFSKNKLLSLRDLQIIFEYSEFNFFGVKVKSSGILEPLTIEKK